MAFEPITTQEAFDAAIGERIKREKESANKRIKELEDQIEASKTTQISTIENLQKEIKEKEDTIANLETEKNGLSNKISGYETASVKTKIAHEVGLPFELASRLSGDDEEAIRADAETMKKIVGAGAPIPPLGDPEPAASAGDNTAEFKSLLKNIKGDE